MCFVRISEQTGIISLYSIKLSVFITKAECVHCAVRGGSPNQTDTVQSQPPTGTPSNSERYCETLKKLEARLTAVRHRTVQPLLQHYSFRPHTTARTAKISLSCITNHTAAIGRRQIIIPSTDSRNTSEDIFIRQTMKLFRQGAQFCRDGFMKLFERRRKCVDSEFYYVQT